MDFFASILIIDSDVSSQLLFQSLFNQYFDGQKFHLFFAENKDEALNFLDKKVFRLIISDSDILKELKEHSIFSSIPVIAVFSEEDDDKEWMKDKFEHFVVKPFSPKIMKTLIEKTLHSKSLKETEKSMDEPLIIGKSVLIKNVLNQIQKVSNYNLSVLLTGESGTGKELVAQSIHLKSSRKDKPFVVVNCGAIQEHLLESELFGHKKGSFTGAVLDKMGLFEAADQGTFFLDELGELPLNLQPKLLRAIQEGVIRPVGSLEEKKVDVRIISATNRNLEKMINDHLFREDLFHRLNVINIHLPPLRSRTEDIVILVDYFLEENKKKYSKKKLVFSKEALNDLKNYSYPGNVRELENIIERAVLLSNSTTIEVGDILTHSSKETVDNILQLDLPQQGFDLDETMSQIEKTILSKAIRRFQGNRLKTAELLRITPRSLKHRIQKYRLAK